MRQEEAQDVAKRYEKAGTLKYHWNLYSESGLSTTQQEKREEDGIESKAA